MDNTNTMHDFMESKLDNLAEINQPFNPMNINNYISSDNGEYDILQANEINMGLLDGLDVTIYRNPAYDFLQMQQLRIGLLEHMDVSVYAYTRYSHLIMREIRLGLADNINLCVYADDVTDGLVLSQLRMSLLHGVDIMPFIKEGYDHEQLKEIRVSLECGIDITPYLDQRMLGMQLHEIRIGLLNKVNVSSYCSSEYNWMQMREIRLGLEQHLDVSFYAKPLVNYSQMKEIRLGLEAGIDVSTYRALMYPAFEMKRRREQLLNEKELREIEFKTSEFKKNDLEDVNAFIESLYHESQNASKLSGKVHFEPDMMAAYLSLPAPKEKDNFTVDNIIEMLQGEGIKQGILKDVIQQMIEDQIYNHPVIVARGKKSVDGADGYYDFHFPLTLPTKPKILEDGSVDYHNMSLFTLVQEDQFIAEYHPATMGTFGYTIKGTVLVPQKGKEKPYLTGHGFYKDDSKTKYFSSLSGKIEYNNFKITISPSYVVQNNVDVSTGNVEFDGDVLVKGDVLSGYTVRATGSISVEGHAENVVLIAGRDIVIKKRIQGNNTAAITAGRNIYGSYFEATTITCGNDLNANYLLNTIVQSYGKVILAGKKGSILGGRVSASNSIMVYTVGNPSMLKTVLQVGSTKEMYEKHDQIISKMEQVQSELRLLVDGRKHIKDSNLELVEPIREMLRKIDVAEQMKNDELLKLSEEHDILAYKFEASKHAKITVKGMSYIGTKIIVQMKSLDITSNVKHVVYSCHNKEHVAVNRL